jgi:flagellar basal body rod protein FlgG
MPGMRALDDKIGGVKVLATATDFSQGPLAPSKNDTDMAVQGDAFFVVRQGNKDLLTRAGNFLLTAAGRLVTQDGKPVLSVDGNPVDLDPDAGPWQLTPDGQISQAGESVALALVRPRSYGDLVKVGENLFAPLAAPRPVPDEERQVLWHQVEQSTVRPSAEMMELIEASRAFEANVNLIHTQDEMLSALVTRALRTE